MVNNYSNHPLFDIKYKTMNAVFLLILVICLDLVSMANFILRYSGTAI